MKNVARMACVAVLGLLLSACATQPMSRDYSAYKASKPRSILVLPPVSHAPDVNASLSVLSVTTLPLAEAGYYVLPVAPVYETFKQNGITVADEAQAVAPEKLREIFGADAALYITVEKYGAVYQIINSVVVVSANAKLVDLRTGTVLWQGQAQASSGENQNNAGGGLVGMLVTAAINQVVNQVTDQGHQMGNVASQRLLSAGHPGGLLYGPYNPKYGTD
ncbi:MULTISPECIES: DUF799 domain-containing protein [Xanthomonas]|uniref:DUF799 domain-containing protein n=1 Tax=Xanthomonas rydalmerensis TaxID=3046274 RepID=A0ABZ0JME0_9XANT|nr:MULTISPECIES: DUF799 domain-containing protein [unclassified Xanthomonas]MBB5943542.1 hypothetical protein [Xanthomonas sp. 3307]WOS40986.1 DUF799 domain-containing protein [Xanthomonas sp. DM-2023]WOS45171.1 DUF799 domain-containing protein [Xanthomonas sp. DM-2023]WOS49350.1 DUF799 domain-containing protein [Xanthomonas sp. DM-2023]WOS53530.1 DUF799 domain-containing protein [Xanthomonas sp. DM-2023]